MFDETTERIETIRLSVLASTERRTTPPGCKLSIFFQCDRVYNAIFTVRYYCTAILLSWMTGLLVGNYLLFINNKSSTKKQAEIWNLNDICINYIIKYSLRRHMFSKRFYNIKLVKEFEFKDRSKESPKIICDKEQNRSIYRLHKYFQNWIIFVCK